MPTQAVLPEDLEEATLGDLQTGEVVYTVPWAMWADMDRNCWLHPGYTHTSTPFGRSAMRVERRADGFHVWLTKGERYSLRSDPGYVDHAALSFIPVLELHR